MNPNLIQQDNKVQVSFEKLERNEFDQILNYSVYQVSVKEGVNLNEVAEHNEQFALSSITIRAFVLLLGQSSYKLMYFNVFDYLDQMVRPGPLCIFKKISEAFPFNRRHQVADDALFVISNYIMKQETRKKNATANQDGGNLQGIAVQKGCKKKKSKADAKNGKAKDAQGKEKVKQDNTEELNEEELNGKDAFYRIDKLGPLEIQNNSDCQSIIRFYYQTLSHAADLRQKQDRQFIKKSKLVFFPTYPTSSLVSYLQPRNKTIKIQDYVPMATKLLCTQKLKLDEFYTLQALQFVANSIMGCVFYNSSHLFYLILMFQNDKGFTFQEVKNKVQQNGSMTLDLLRRCFFTKDFRNLAQFNLIKDPFIDRICLLKNKTLYAYVQDAVKQNIFKQGIIYACEIVLQNSSQLERIITYAVIKYEPLVNQWVILRPELIQTDQLPGCSTLIQELGMLMNFNSQAQVWEVENMRFYQADFKPTLIQQSSQRIGCVKGIYMVLRQAESVKDLMDLKNHWHSFQEVNMSAHDLTGVDVRINKALPFAPINTKIDMIRENIPTINNHSNHILQELNQTTKKICNLMLLPSMTSEEFCILQFHRKHYLFLKDQISKIPTFIKEYVDIKRVSRQHYEAIQQKITRLNTNHLIDMIVTRKDRLPEELKHIRQFNEYYKRNMQHLQVHNQEANRVDLKSLFAADGSDQSEVDTVNLQRVPNIPSQNANSTAVVLYNNQQQQNAAQSVQRVVAQQIGQSSQTVLLLQNPIAPQNVETMQNAPLAQNPPQMQNAPPVQNPTQMQNAPSQQNAPLRQNRPPQQVEQPGQRLQSLIQKDEPQPKPEQTSKQRHRRRENDAQRKKKKSSRNIKEKQEQHQRQIAGQLSEQLLSSLNSPSKSASKQQNRDKIEMFAKFLKSFSTQKGDEIKKSYKGRNKKKIREEYSDDEDQESYDDEDEESGEDEEQKESEVEGASEDEDCSDISEGFRKDQEGGDNFDNDLPFDDQAFHQQFENQNQDGLEHLIPKGQSKTQIETQKGQYEESFFNYERPRDENENEKVHKGKDRKKRLKQGNKKRKRGSNQDKLRDSKFQDKLQQKLGKTNVQVKMNQQMTLKESIEKQNLVSANQAEDNQKTQTDVTEANDKNQIVPDGPNVIRNESSEIPTKRKKPAENEMIQPKYYNNQQSNSRGKRPQRS